jgi:hypothetical protein
VVLLSLVAKVLDELEVAVGTVGMVGLGAGEFRSLSLSPLFVHSQSQAASVPFPTTPTSWDSGRLPSFSLRSPGNDDRML